MAATVAGLPATPTRHPFDHEEHDAFAEQLEDSNYSYQHRFSSTFDIDPLDLTSTSSPAQVKRTIEAHLHETDRRLFDTQKLGTSLLKQREDLTSRLEEVDQYQDEAQIPGDLRKRLADIEREHADVGREVARALIGPKAKQDDLQYGDSSVFTSQATASPTKISAPSRRHRNQPSTRAGDLQFAADISTSLLAQVRQLQAAVAERDDALKQFHADRETSDRDLQAYSQKVRALDESEQKYKDENWNLETQKHELLVAAKDAQDKEKRLNAVLSAAVLEKNRLQNDLDEINIAHSKLCEEHTATKKAHDTEIHGLKRNVDAADIERQSMQDKINELVVQNQELAKAISTRSRSRQANIDSEIVDSREENAQNLDTPEDSPPPSPTKATPRHGGLESETLRSSLHHAHRMIQNLKGNIHREKTEKIELKRMLQDARDELEQRRGVDSGSAAKRQKTKPDPFKKPARPDMLGGSRRARTDVELTDDDWEDHNIDSPSQTRSNAIPASARANMQELADASDAYQTANDTEGTFDTADERNTTESEAFMTGAESLAGDSTDELTETEDTASRTGHRVAPGRVARASMGNKHAGDRAAYLSTATTSGDEGDESQTPMQSSFTRFKLRNNPSSYSKPGLFAQPTSPESYRSPSISQDSPATVMTAQSPPGGEQSLFAELGGMDEINSETQSLQSTPARSSTLSSQHSTPGLPYTPSKSAVPQGSSEVPAMIDSSTMTETWSPVSKPTVGQIDNQLNGAPQESLSTALSPERSLLPSAFPLPPSVPTSPVRKTDTSTQYTPQRSVMESPIRPGSSYITPPKMVWDDEHEVRSSPGEDDEQESEARFVAPLSFSKLLSQDSAPDDAAVEAHAAMSRDLETSRNELMVLRTNLDQKHAHLETLQKDHTAELLALKKQIAQYDVDKSDLSAALSASDAHRKDVEVLQKDHSHEMLVLKNKVAEYDTEVSNLHAALKESNAQKQNVEALQRDHAEQLSILNSQISHYDVRMSELQATIAASNTREMDSKAQCTSGGEENLILKQQISKYDAEISSLRTALEASESQRLKNSEEIERLRSALRVSEQQRALLSASAYSTILSQETHPVQPSPVQHAIVSDSRGILPPPSPVEPQTPERPRTAEKVLAGGMLISAATTLGFAGSHSGKKPQPNDNEIHDSVLQQKDLAETATSSPKNIFDEEDTYNHRRSRALFVPELVNVTAKHDQASQTLLTSEQLEEALRSKQNNTMTPMPLPVRTHSPTKRTPVSPTRYPKRQSSQTREVALIIEDTANLAAPTSPQRPGSAASNRTSSLVSQQHPPLPPDHKDVIAKANVRMASPTRKESSTVRAGGIMGPPTMPASAMRRPRTPNESLRSPTPQQSSMRKRGTSSRMSRRSSVSSFASELDERFNIRPEQQAATHGFEAGPGTDPRMIQAITQTMIGEFLWKYTRKTGSKEMSTTRHRRYFWVHPYTKTLYWSDQDPQTAGRTELKAKSVAIESVRVVSDDNPMPPGLHRKSLEVTTPGRKVKFTASTGQRHETWFNALSYLLNRNEEQEGRGRYVTGENDITQDDLAEFSVNGYGARLIPNDSRTSMSSYNSRTTRGTASKRVSHAGRTSQQSGIMPGAAASQSGRVQVQSSTTQVDQDTIRRSRPEALQATDKDRTIRAGSVSRISKMFGSVTGRSRGEEVGNGTQTSSNNRVSAGESSSIYDASVVSDGRREEEEELRRQQERAANPGLEDVRACCDGKHNVSTLTHRHIPTSSTQNRISNAINRSMSRRT